MKENISPAKSAVSYGVIFGVIMILEFVIAYAMDIDPVKHAWVGILNSLLNYLILPILFIILACNHFKKHNGGFISFSQSLKAGVSVTVIAGSIFAVFNIIFNLIFPEFQDEMFEKIKEITVMQNPNMSSEQLEMTLKWTKTFMDPLVAAPFTIVIYTFIGLIFSLIIGAIIKKDNPGAFQQ